MEIIFEGKSLFPLSVIVHKSATRFAPSITTSEKKHSTPYFPTLSSTLSGDGKWGLEGNRSCNFIAKLLLAFIQFKVITPYML